MNAKLAKKLRKAARKAASGMDESRLLAKFGRDSQGRKTRQAVNDSDTRRGFYRQLKREAREIQP